MSPVQKSLRTRVLRLIAFLLTILGLSQASLRADALCGPTTAIRLIVYGDGYVTVHASWRGDWTTICNLNQEWKGVSPSTCFSWFAKINSAINEGKPVGMWYAVENPAACAGIPNYGSAPPPAYVE